MKRQSGFTLIELVIVIIILGILAATAVPKFVDLQGDARESAMNGVKGALEGAATLTFSRAAIDGNEKAGSGETANGVNIVFGYPEASEVALTEVAGLSADDWDFDDTSVTDSVVIMAEGVAYSATEAEQCQVTYLEATSSARPTITAQVDGC